MELLTNTTVARPKQPPQLYYMDLPLPGHPLLIPQTPSPSDTEADAALGLGCATTLPPPPHLLKNGGCWRLWVPIAPEDVPVFQEAVALHKEAGQHCVWPHVTVPDVKLLPACCLAWNKPSIPRYLCIRHIEKIHALWFVWKGQSLRRQVKFFRGNVD